MHNFIRSHSLPVLCLALLMSGCASIGLNLGGGVSSDAEYDYQPPWIKRQYQAALETMDSGDDAVAAEAFEQFVDAHPHYPGAYVNLAIIYDRLDRPDDAYVMLDTAKNIMPGYVTALNQEGLIKRRRGDFAGAQEAWLEATRSDPDFANAWFNLGVLYDLYLQDLPAALDAYQRYQLTVAAVQEGAEPDPQVQGWITDIERRIGQTAQAAQVSEAL